MGPKELKEHKSSLRYGAFHLSSTHPFPFLRGLPKHIKQAKMRLLAFSPVTGGNYNGGSLNNTGNGNWWSTNANGGTNRWNLKYNGSYLYTKYNSRYNGFYVRCVKS